MKIKPLVLILGSTLAAASTAMATPDSSSMSFGVSVTAVGGATGTDAHSDSWTGTPSVIQASANAFSSDANGAQSQAFASGISSIAADGNSGIMNMTFGWYDVDASSSATNLSITPDWTYTFTSDVTGTFNLDFSVTGNGSDLFGLQGWYESDNFDTPLGSTNGSALDPTASGSLFGDVTQGQTYTVRLSNNGNIFSSGAYNATATAVGDFSFDITGTSNSVPDKGSTVLLVGLAAVALLGVGSRFRFARS